MPRPKKGASPPVFLPAPYKGQWRDDVIRGADVDKGAGAFLKDIMGIASDAAQERLGVTQDEGDDVGHAIARQVRDLWGGLSVYITKTDTTALAHKNREIYEAWRQEGISLDLCQRFNLSEQRIRQIVKVELARRQKAGTAHPQ